MEQIPEYVGNGDTWEGGEVPCRLNYGVLLLDISKICYFGIEVQLRPLYGHGVPVRRFLEGTITLPRAQDAPLTSTARKPDEDAGGQYLLQVAARAVQKPDKQATCHNLWISDEMWKLVNDRVSARQEPRRDQMRLRQLGQATRTTLK